MSGIVGLINVGGAPVDRQLLQKMTEFMAYRGPDAQVTWIDGHVGLGHTMLRTTQESLHERQPFSLNGEVWITSDARLDGRTELTEKLRFEGCTIPHNVTDGELILHAYQVWRDDCIHHLIGDFCFALWDKRRKHLFCVRDQLGVKPFYYAQLAHFFIFSNTLDCVRFHPAVSDQLNDLAIGDFLLFGFNQDPTTTTFCDIQRLPPAHSLSWSNRKLRLNRYWTLPTNGRIRYKRASDYVDHFRGLLRTAVKDRLRTDHVGVFMSGGLDSTAIAATAHELLSRECRSFELRAYTVVYDRLIVDGERYYSDLVADALGIPAHYLVADDYTPCEGWNQRELHRPEPSDNPLLAMFADQLKQLAAHGRVALTGWDGDTVLNESARSYFGVLLKGCRFGRLVADMGQYVWSQRELPPVAFRTTLRRLLGKRSHRGPAYPTWFNQAFARRLGLPARWEQISTTPPPIHPLRPDAYRALTSTIWLYLFENYDAGVTRVPLEVRHPLVDLRLVNYLLSIPPVPWCIRKELLRVAMRGVLPEPVRCRQKTPLAGDPVLEALRHRHQPWIDDFSATSELSQYIDRKAIPQIVGEEDPNRLWLNLRPLSLNLWLQYSKPLNAALEKEACYGTT